MTGEASLSANQLVHSIDQLLPQTQCTKCDYPRCLDYARAIATGEADINQCPPGNDITIARLAELLDRDALPLDPRHGAHQPLQVAFVVEEACIGCKLCIKACPVDCIVGSTRLMHTVVARDCTGCELCLPVCPTDCIVMVQPPERTGADARDSAWPEYSARLVARSRTRTQQKLDRVARQQLEREQQKISRRRLVLQQEILAAVERKRK